MNFYEAQAMMGSLIIGDMAQETLAVAEDKWEQMSKQDQHAIENDEVLTIDKERLQCPYATHYSRDIPPGEDIKWMCGDCGATNWTPNERRCIYCKE